MNPTTIHEMFRMSRAERRRLARRYLNTTVLPTLCYLAAAALALAVIFRSLHD